MPPGSAARSNTRRATEASCSSAAGGAPATRSSSASSPGNALTQMSAWPPAHATLRAAPPPPPGAASGAPAPPRLAQLARRSAVSAAEGIVEAAAAAKSRRHGDLGNRQVGFLKQAHGEVQTPCLRNGDRRGADVAPEQAQQVPRSDAQSAGKRVHRLLIEGALVDKAQRTAHDRGGPQPRSRAGRGLGTAAQARTESRSLGGRRRAEEAHIGALRIA